MRAAARAVDDVGDKTEYAAERAEHMERATRGATRAQRMFNASARASAGGMRVFGMGLGGIGTLMGVAGVAGAARKMGEEVQESNKAMALTRARIKSTGGAAGVTSKHIERLSGSVSKMIGRDDEAIQANANMLLTFKNVKAEGGIFDRAVVSAQDLATDFGSAESATKMLGKALQDPAVGMTALGRAGVTFTEQQKDQIEALQESGDLLEAQKIIMREVESQVGGSAKSQRTAIERLTTGYDNLMESLGKLAAPTARRWLTRMARGVEDLDAIVSDKSATWPEKFDKIGAMMERRFGPSMKGAGRAILDGIEWAMPRAAERVAENAPKVAAAFVRGFMDAGIWGKLLIGGWLLTKMGGLGAFRALGRRGGLAMGVGMGAGAVAGMNAGPNGKPSPKPASRASNAMGSVKRGLGKVPVVGDVALLTWLGLEAGASKLTKANTNAMSDDLLDGFKEQAQSIRKNSDSVKDYNRKLDDFRSQLDAVADKQATFVSEDKAVQESVRRSAERVRELASDMRGLSSALQGIPLERALELQAALDDLANAPMPTDPTPGSTRPPGTSANGDGGGNRKVLTAGTGPRVRARGGWLNVTVPVSIDGREVGRAQARVGRRELASA
jgi:hypothetical protein